MEGREGERERSEGEGERSEGGIYSSTVQKGLQYKCTCTSLYKLSRPHLTQTA